MAPLPTRVSVALHTSQFVYAMSYEMFQVAMPSIVDELVGRDGADSTYSGLKAFFALLQLLGGLALGQLADVVGAKRVLLIAHVCSALHYFFLAQTTTHWQAYLAFIPTIFQAGSQAAQTVSSEWSDEKDRIAALGRLWISYALGGVFGALVAGKLIMKSTPADALTLAGLCSMLVTMALAVYLPSSPQRRGHGSAATASDDETEASHLARLTASWSKVLRLRGVSMFLMLTAAEGLFSGMLIYTLPELARLHYGMGPAMLGPLIAVELITFAVSQGIVAPYLVDRLQPEKLVGYGLLTAAAGSLMLTLMPATPIVLYVGIVPLFLGIGVQNVLLAGVGTWIVPAANLGAILSLNEAFGAAIPGMFSPLMATAINSTARWPALPAVEGVLLLLISFFVFRGDFAPILCQQGREEADDELDGEQRCRLTKDDPGASELEAAPE